MLAIDPGTTQTAFVALAEDKRILDKGIVPNGEMLAFCELLDPSVKDVAIEMIACYGMPVGKEVFETCVWIGKFAYVLEKKGLKVTFIYRKDVKMHLCGSSRAKDGNIRQALIDKLGQPGTKKAPGPTFGVAKDIWAALAVGITFIESRR